MAPVWASSLALSAGSPAESNNPASCARSPGPVQTPAPPTVDFVPLPEPLAVYARRSPPGTSDRVARRNRITQHLAHGHPGQSKLPRHRPLTLSLYQNRSPYTPVDLHLVHQIG